MVLLQLAEGQEPEPSAMEEILSHGEPDAPHAGMVRVVFEQEVPGMTWSDLETKHRASDRFDHDGGSFAL